MTKAREESLKRIRQAIATIEQLVLLEQKHISMQRKKQMENAYASLSLHAHKLGIQLPQLSTFYRPEQYLSHARLVADKLEPVIVCLCGSTRFMAAFQDANLRETLAMKIVLSVGCDTKSDAMLNLGDEVKAQLDALHLRKIDLADEVLILNVGRYVGESTSREICYAEEHGKYVRWLEPMGFDVFRAADQGRCARCDAAACWLRLDAGQSVPTAALCARHAWVNGVKVL